jgi:hypothetical protein
MTEQSVTSGEDLKDVDTGATPQTNDQDERNFSQKDVDKIVQARLEKYKKRFADFDMNEYKTLKAAEEEREIEAMKKREEFDDILKSQKDKYSSEISTLRSELTSLKVDGTLLDVAAKRNAVSPEQVAQLVVFSTSGEVEYDPETAEPRTIESYVNEWLDKNPHFIRSSPGGVVSNGSAGSVKTGPVDLSSLDLTKHADREKYKQLKAEGKL